jgi:MFS family permease
VIAIGSVLGLALGMIVGGYVSEWAGWRMAFIVAGLPGIVFSIVFFATIREPAAGTQRGASWRETLRHMAAIPTYRWLLAGQSMALLSSLGRNLWEPTFLRRIYGMGAGEAGLWYFFTSPLPSAFGIFLGGFLADRLWRRDRRWSLWVPTIGQLVCVPLLAAFLLWPEEHRLPFGAIEGGFPVALFFSVAASIAGSLYAAPMLSTTQGLAPVVMRARAAALASAVSSLIGSGVGPLVVGDLNVRFEPTFGEEAIRYSLLTIVMTTLVSVAFWYAASRHVRVDFDRAEAAESSET